MCDTDDAEDYLLEAESLFRYFLRESTNLADASALCDVYFNLGSMFSQGRSFQLCERNLHAALRLARALKVYMPWPSIKNKAIACHAKLSDLYRAWSKAEEAAEHASQAASLMSDGTDPG